MCFLAFLCMILLQFCGLLFSLFFFLQSDSSASWRSTSRWRISSSKRHNYFSSTLPLSLDLSSPVLIIAGSDGSGTRAFVDAIRQLGVPIVADDKETFDLHGVELFKRQGWPALVNMVLRYTHSGDYEWDDLPEGLKQTINPEVSHLLFKTTTRYRAMSKAAAEKGQIAGTPTVEGVSYAIKAPISMLVLPVLKKFYGNIKFLHVLRDGRDVALSSNQSPVAKFYDSMYTDSQNRSLNLTGELQPVKGMQLWNDWNLQVHNWSKRQNGTVDYLVMRSEDLLDPSKRFERLEKLADFVGSNIAKDKLCCLSQKSTVDFGASSHFGQDLADEKRAGFRRPFNPLRGKRFQRHDPFGDLGALEEKELRGHMHRQDSIRQDTAQKARIVAQQDRDSFEQQGSPALEGDVSPFKKMSLEQADQLQLDAFDGESPQRRRLTEETAIFFLDYERWKESTNQTERMEYNDITKLISIGGGLQAWWKKNSEMLDEKISESDIVETLNLLERLADERRANPITDNHAEINQRYGKWEKALENRSEVFKYFHREGAEGLKLFGYEPRKQFTYQSNPNANAAFTCNADVTCFD
jgi:hypothetical protein